MSEIMILAVCLQKKQPGSWVRVPFKPEFFQVAFSTAMCVVTTQGMQADNFL